MPTIEVVNQILARTPSSCFLPVDGVRPGETYH
jgi:hypothetical protein